MKAIEKYETELNLTPQKYLDQKPDLHHTFKPIEISKETIYRDLHRIQAELARTQFIAQYKYFRKHPPYDKSDSTD